MQCLGEVEIARGEHASRLKSVGRNFHFAMSTCQKKQSTCQVFLLYILINNHDRQGLHEASS